MPASRWRRLLKLKRKKNSFKIIIGFFFTPPLFLATKVAISFVYCSPKTIKCTQKPKIEKKFTGIDQSSERASERVPFPTSYLQLALAHARNSRVKNDIDDDDGDEDDDGQGDDDDSDDDDDDDDDGSEDDDDNGDDDDDDGDDDDDDIDVDDDDDDNSSNIK